MHQERHATKITAWSLIHSSREFVFYIHENALRLPVGGPEVMKALKGIDQFALDAEHSMELIAGLVP
ncbi:hypothetical protein [Lentzea flaviverrucosa]|uniref:Uncharacterized protein n=1 Tax=Lentzea flaviverrucosa TaxID=200379 RepID=A0A1H9X011_9PSEU|nr:hypothetical protein [Lentzea flaviverrucosa]RDI21027.1 hypothetical protein DFR72_114251 [Lentzea flaviverrucosa]SES39381.1 hypothetical protein SAMN05216195_11337 [Lentzea flaviverrucosa]